MKLFDLHCDTLYRAFFENGGLFNNDFHISFDKTDGIEPYIQCMAVWVPDEFRNKNAMQLFENCRKKLNDELKDTNIKIIRSHNDIIEVESKKSKGVVLTVEGGAVLGGKLENVDYLTECGVKIMTLTWNGNCELGDGIGVEGAKGLTDFGKSVVAKMEQNGIVVDVSHSSVPMFYDVAELSTKPFCATHSNSKQICPHRRNLTDEQFSIIKDKGGIVGLNLSRGFLREDEDKACMLDVLRHAEHFLSLGGEKTLAIGTDFDGTDIPIDMTGIESMNKLYELFLKHNYNEKLLEDIFFNNARNFLLRF
ncbi:MAG: membrane dipeptidase [Candidatus Pseudoruminococcus sp.]|uniref:dipeptidase n=1 Tax=Candidatus Pseudoruminococcus sp. TaxID=3101048 RepID=UPI002A7C6728|nr:membrane dipeptidase [Ruminococcus sp.]MDY2781852.1 membrane dipeptidase [Candidatus Pseudoruminococcus sp.]